MCASQPEKWLNPKPESTNQATIHAREIFKRAILAGAIAITIAHNHPSGDSTPSPEDILLTRRLREAAAIIGIPLVDHVIVARDSFVSLAQELGADY